MLLYCRNPSNGSLGFLDIFRCITISGGLFLAFGIRSDVAFADPKRDQVSEMVHAMSDCMVREAQKQTLAKLDLETAAYAVLAKCAQERAAHREYMRHHWPGSHDEFDAWWEKAEARDLNFAKQAIALVRSRGDKK